MKSLLLPLTLLEWVGLGLFLLGLFGLTALAVGSPAGLPRRAWARYVVFLESKLRRMYIWTSGQKVAIGQVAAVGASLALHVVFGLPGWYLLAALVAVGPAVWIERMRRKRVEAVEAQIDGFLVAVSSALKATPALGDAFASVAGIVSEPMGQDIATAVKQMRLGATLDQALLLMASRVGSRELDSALSAILIGRQVGGNLPKILDSTAASIREMQRLEGVVRTKTADAKMQMWVLGLFPLGIILAVSSLDQTYFDPLTTSFVGYILVVVAVVFWGSALVLARKILAVDI